MADSPLHSPSSSVTSLSETSKDKDANSIRLFKDSLQNPSSFNQTKDNGILHLVKHRRELEENKSPSRKRLYYIVFKAEILTCIFKAPSAHGSSIERRKSPENARFEGVLSKWTNYASGYKRRWFVLEDGKK
jgi:hypothetical protein